MVWSPDIPPAPVRPPVTGWWTVIVSNVAAQLKKLQVNMIGDVPMIGTQGSTLKKLQISLAGIEHPMGTISGTPLKLQAALQGEQRQTGALAVTSGKLASALVGAMFPKGTISSQMRSLVVSFAAQQIYQGALAATTKPLSSSLSGEIANYGTVGASLQKISAAIVGDMPPSGFIDADLKMMTALMAGEQAQVGAITPSFKTMSALLSGGQTQIGAVGASLGKLGANVSGAQIQSGLIASAMKQLSASVAGYERPEGVIAATLKLTAVALAGGQTQTGTVAASLQKASSLLNGIQSQEGTLAASLAKAVAALAGDVVSGSIPTFAAESNEYASGGTVSSASVDINAPTGSTVRVFININNGGRSISSVTHAGTAMTFVAQKGTNDSVSSGYVSMYKLVIGTSGNQTITTTFSGATRVTMYAVAYLNDNYEQIVTSYGTGHPTLSVVPNATQIAIGVLATNNQNVSSSSGGSLLAEFNNNGNGSLVVREATTSATITATVDNTNSDYAGMGVLVSTTPVGVSFNAVTTNVTNWAASLAVNHTAPAGAMIIVDVISSAAYTAPTYGGAAMTLVAAIGWTSRYKYVDVAGGTKSASFDFPGGGGAGIVVRSYLNAADVVFYTEAGAGQAVSQSAILDSGEMAVSIFGAKNGSASGGYFTSPAGGTVDANFQDGNRTGMCAMSSDVTTTFTATGNPSYYNGWDSITSIIKPVAPTAVLFDAAGAGTSGTASSATASHTAKLGSTLLVTVTTLTGTVTAATYNGVAMTLLRTTTTTITQAIYVIKNVPADARNIGITFSGNTQYSISSASYLNVVDIYAFNPITGTGGTMSASAVIGAGEMIMHAWGLRGSDILSQAGGTFRVENDTGFASTSISDADVSTTFTADPGGNFAWIGCSVILSTTTKTIQFVGYAYGLATPTVGTLTCQIGDLLIAATSKGATGMPTPPTGWTALSGGVSASGYSTNAAYKFATATTDVTQAWGNSPNANAVFIFRYVSAIGAQSTAGSNSSVNTVNFPALTLQALGTSWVMNIGARNSAFSAGRAGYTRRLAGFSVEDYDSAAPVASNVVASGNITQSNSSPWRIWAVELKR